ncbi:MAG: exodeoxyribonuclease V subunit alpha [Chitinivibrionales bacterium]|nr:exodeoxyribonuclease V subunit alpha [Chitinivibrionales bacterium]
MNKHTPRQTAVTAPPIEGLRVLDTSFARLMGRLSAHDTPELHLAATLVSHAAAKGHICLDLADPHAALPQQAMESPPPFPDAAAWRKSLASMPVVGTPGEHAPLILDGTRVYLQRHWADECLLADAIAAYGARDSLTVDDGRVRTAIERFLPAERHDLWQRAAACVAATRPLCVVTGGPGTGKTTTVALILAVLLDLDPSLRIALAAPTGKAAARMQQALVQARDERLGRMPDLLERFPNDAMTIHRLLGARANGGGFVHDTNNPIGVDALVLDEASMIDLPLMARLLEALPQSCRLLILGDRNQLSSVEAGAVLGDLCSTTALQRFSCPTARRIGELTGTALPQEMIGGDRVSVADSLVELTVVHRFSSSLGAVSAAVRAGDAPAALRRIESSGDISWHPAKQGASWLTSTLEQRIVTGFTRYLQATTMAERFDALQDFRILCALRQGPYGVAAINALVERILTRAGALAVDGPFYEGRPLMVTRNDYALELYNGDIGCMVMTPEGRRAAFVGPSGEPRLVSPHRLNAVETAFAITVHKSQGSELRDVMLLLPDRDSPVLTRELIYTGLTRARKSALIVAVRDVLETAIRRVTRRTSGLAERLWGVDAADCGAC